MKTTVRKSTYEKVMQMPKKKHRNPLRPLFLLQIVIRILSFFELLSLKLTVRKEGMEKIGKDEPCLILMNHSSFTDLEIASHIFFPKRYGIVTTTDGFVGPVMRLLMPLLGCIPTQKFVSDMSLIRDMQYMLKEKKTSVLMFPEAGYSFDGTATVLPRKMGILLKKLDVPVVTVITNGAYFRQPLYNDLQKRKTTIVADVKCMVTREELKQLSVAELDAKLEEAFSFDNFRWQQENNVVIDEPFRADGLNRILYKCPPLRRRGKNGGQGDSSDLPQLRCQVPADGNRLLKSGKCSVQSRARLVQLAAAGSSQGTGSRRLSTGCGCGRCDAGQLQRAVYGGRG